MEVKPWRLISKSVKTVPAMFSSVKVHVFHFHAAEVVELSPGLHGWAGRQKVVVTLPLSCQRSVFLRTTLSFLGVACMARPFVVTDLCAMRIGFYQQDELTKDQQMKSIHTDVLCLCLCHCLCPLPPRCLLKCLCLGCHCSFRSRCLYFFSSVYVSVFALRLTVAVFLSRPVLVCDVCSSLSSGSVYSAAISSQ